MDRRPLCIPFELYSRERHKKREELTGNTQNEHTAQVLRIATFPDENRKTFKSCIPMRKNKYLDRTSVHL